LSTKHGTTGDRFGWPVTQSSLNGKKPLTYADEEYRKWLEFLSNNKIQGIITTTITPTTLISISPRQQYQPIGYFPTKTIWKSVTTNTPQSKRQHPQQNPAVSERNAVGIQTNGKNYLIYAIRQFYLHFDQGVTFFPFYLLI
jgi:hypothetical protein